MKEDSTWTGNKKSLGPEPNNISNICPVAELGVNFSDDESD